MTFSEFLLDSAAKGEAVNTMFEERLFELVGVLQKVTEPLVKEGIAHELIGGLAVLVHVEEADPTHATLTRDVDLMIHRADLGRVKQAAEQHGFHFRHSAGLDMLLYGSTDSARNAVRLLFSGERVRPQQVAPNPPIDPVEKEIHGHRVFVIRLRDLLVMKLSAFRDKDRVHVRSMDAAGLLTPEVEMELPVDLADRLRHVRETE